MHTLKKKISLSVKTQRKIVHQFLGHHSWVTLKSERVVKAAEGRQQVLVNRTERGG